MADACGDNSAYDHDHCLLASGLDDVVHACGGHNYSHGVPYMQAEDVWWGVIEQSHLEVLVLLMSLWSLSP